MGKTELRTPEYREQVVEGLHFGKTAEAKRPYLSKDDLEACKDVVSRKAAAFWVEGTPRTTIARLHPYWSSGL